MTASAGGVLVVAGDAQAVLRLAGAEQALDLGRLGVGECDLTRPHGGDEPQLRELVGTGPDPLELGPQRLAAGQRAWRRTSAVADEPGRAFSTSRRAVNAAQHVAELVEAAARRSSSARCGGVGVAAGAAGRAPQAHAEQAEAVEQLLRSSA